MSRKVAIDGLLHPGSLSEENEALIVEVVELEPWGRPFRLGYENHFEVPNRLYAKVVTFAQRVFERPQNAAAFVALTRTNE